MAIARTGLFPKHLDRDIDRIFTENYARYPKQYARLAKTEDFPEGDHLTEAEVGGLGQVRQIGEGQGVDFAVPSEGHEKTVYPSKYGLGFQITEEMIEDAVHKNIEKAPKALSTSMNHKLELTFWDLFNSGDDTHTAWDSSYIFSTHTLLDAIDSSYATIDNHVTSALSETTLQAAFEYFAQMVDQNGYPVTLTPRNLVIPTKLMWMANRLARQNGGITPWDGDAPLIEYDGSSAADQYGHNMSGNMMSTNPKNGFVDTWNVLVTRYLDPQYGGDDENWFFVADEHDMRKIWKRKVRMETGFDFHTGNKLYKVTARWADACFDYRGVYGSFVT